MSTILRCLLFLLLTSCSHNLHKTDLAEDRDLDGFNAEILEDDERLQKTLSASIDSCRESKQIYAKKAPDPAIASLLEARLQDAIESVKSMRKNYFRLNIDRFSKFDNEAVATDHLLNMLNSCLRDYQKVLEKYIS